MHLDTIAVPKEEAEAKLAEYTGALREERNAEDEAIAAAYRAAARGLQIISLPQVIAAGGWHDNGLPRIAIARATWTGCTARWSGNDLLFFEDEWARNNGARVGKNIVRVAIGDRPSRAPWQAGRAPVPLVPPRHRPRRYRLSRCHILWEVETWSPVPAHDPALVRHIRGDLWAVLAVWDLTDVERAVLSGRP
jgi:hypothetical protein